MGSKEDALEEALFGNFGEGELTPLEEALFYLGLQAKRYIDLIERNAERGLALVEGLREDNQKLAEEEREYRGR